MAANDRPRPRFEEQAALDELERLRQALEDTRQRRKQATEAFDSFLRSFQRPDSSSGPATPEPSAGAQRPPGPPAGPVAREVESPRPEPPAPQPPAVETLRTVEVTRMAEAAPSAEVTLAIEATPVAGVTPIAAATASAETESRAEGEARVEVTPIDEAPPLSEPAPATATTEATPVSEAPPPGEVARPAAHVDRPVFQPAVAAPEAIPAAWTESQATADDGTVDESAPAEVVRTPAASAISAASVPAEGSDTFVTLAAEGPTDESRPSVPFMPDVLPIERSKVPLMAAIGGALVIVVAASIYFMGRGGAREETAPAARPQSSVETAAPATSQPAPPPAAVPQPAAVPEGGIQGELTTVRVSWVRVTVDGEKTIERELPAGAKIPLVARQSIVVRAGDAGAVRVTIDGKDQGSFGPDGAVATRTFQRR